MTREDLDRTYSEVSWEIVKRSSSQALKSLLIGHESLERLIQWIDATYQLSEEDRRRLHPTKSIDVTDGITTTADVAKKWAGVGATSVEAKQLFEIFQKAKQSGRVVRTAQTLIKHGTKAAGQVARTGKVAAKTASKASPILLGVQIAYTVGSTGWFAVCAQRYNRACYGLLVSRLPDDGATDVAAA